MSTFKPLPPVPLRPPLTAVFRGSYHREHLTAAVVPSSISFSLSHHQQTPSPLSPSWPSPPHNCRQTTIRPPPSVRASSAPPQHHLRWFSSGRICHLHRTPWRRRSLISLRRCLLAPLASQETSSLSILAISHPLRSLDLVCSLSLWISLCFYLLSSLKPSLSLVVSLLLLREKKKQKMKVRVMEGENGALREKKN